MTLFIFKYHSHKNTHLYKHKKNFFPQTRSFLLTTFPSTNSGNTMPSNPTPSNFLPTTSTTPTLPTIPPLHQKTHYTQVFYLFHLTLDQSDRCRQVLPPLRDGLQKSQCPNGGDITRLPAGWWKGLGGGRGKVGGRFVLSERELVGHRMCCHQQVCIVCREKCLVVGFIVIN